MTQPTYTETLAELEKILAELESNQEIDMEQIVKKVQRATELVAQCKNRLHSIDENLEKILQQLDD